MHGAKSLPESFDEHDGTPGHIEWSLDLFGAAAETLKWAP